MEIHPCEVARTRPLWWICSLRAATIHLRRGIGVDLVSDAGTFSLKGGAEAEFYLNLSRCIEVAWQSVGASAGS